MFKWAWLCTIHPLPFLTAIMKFLLEVTLILSLSYCVFSEGTEYSDFLSWAAIHLSGVDDLSSYYPQWKKNADFVNQHNSAQLGYTVELNKFAHLSPETLLKSKIILQPPHDSKHFNSKPLFDPPSEVNWVDKGVVLPVKNQDQYDCSVEIVLVDAVSSLHAIKTGHLVAYSYEELIDCCTPDCQCRHLESDVVQCIKRLGGLCSDYPNTNGSQCICHKCNGNRFPISFFMNVMSGNETALAYAVANQPVMVAVDAGHSSFQLYHSGVYSSDQCSSTKLDHSMLVVGYGNYGGEDYWLCQNSWGASWGMNGYIMIARNKNNMCGIATMASYPVE